MSKSRERNFQLVACYAVLSSAVQLNERPASFSNEYSQSLWEYLGKILQDSVNTGFILLTEKLASERSSRILFFVAEEGGLLVNAGRKRVKRRSI